MSEPWTAERAREFFSYEAQPKEYVKHCDLCGAPGGDGKANRDRYGFPVQHVQCVRCGLVYQVRPMATAGLRALYSGPYRALVSAWHGRPINVETLEPEQNNYAAKLKIEIKRALGIRHDVEHPDDVTSRWALPWRRVLDLGGSTGAVGALFAWHKKHTHLTVVEPSMAEAAVAARRADRVVVQPAEDFEPGDERWDLILLCQAVDHLRSISTVLRKVRTWLAPGGRFFVDAVDWEKVRGDGPAYNALKIDHVYALTPATMRRYLESAGFVAREVPAPSENHVAFLCEVKA